MTTTITRAESDAAPQYSETEPVPFVLVEGPVWGVQLPDGSLWREPHARIADPEGDQATVFFRRDRAQEQIVSLHRVATNWYGVVNYLPRVVPVIRDAKGLWVTGTAERAEVAK